MTAPALDELEEGPSATEDVEAAEDESGTEQPASDDGASDGDEEGRRRRSADRKAASEKVQLEVDRERRNRSRGLGFLWGEGWYAGAAGRDRYDFSGPGDANVAQAGRDVNHVNNYYSAPGDSRAIPRFGPILWQDLESHRKRHVETSSDSGLLAHVCAHEVTLLTGAADTGRRDSAVWALAETVVTKAGEDSVQVAEVTRIEALFPRDKAAKSADSPYARGWELEDGKGYVLDATDLRESIRQSAVGILRQRVRESGGSARLIIIADKPILSDDLERHQIQHAVPRLPDVFKRHLKSGMPAYVGEVTPSLLAGGLNEEIRQLKRPRDAVRLAVDLAVQVTRKRPVIEILQELPVRRLERIRQVFEDEADDKERSLVVAAAAFQGLPVGTIVRVYEQLIKLLPDKRHKPQPFLKGLAGCWSEYVTGFNGLDEPEATEGLDPPIVLRPPTLGREVLVMAWRDYPSLRVIMVRWLSALVSDDDTSVRIQAAQIVGLFAVHDFDHVAETTLRRWRTASNRKRAAFSWAVEAAAGADERTAGKVRTWLRSENEDARSIDERATLVRAYRTKIGALFPDDALHAVDALLKKIAADADVVRPSWNLDSGELGIVIDGRIDIAAPVVTEIFAGGAIQQVLLTLHRWTTHKPTAQRGLDARLAAVRQLVAAGAMARIARLPAPGPPGECPPLLLRAVADGEVKVDRILPIWRNALDDTYMGARSHEVLRLWVEAPDHESDPEVELKDRVCELVRKLARESRLQERRLHHEIKQWKRSRGGTPFRAFPTI